MSESVLFPLLYQTSRGHQGVLGWVVKCKFETCRILEPEVGVPEGALTHIEDPLTTSLKDAARIVELEGHLTRFLSR